NSLSDEPGLVQAEGLVECARRRAERHVQTIPRVDAHHAKGQRRELLLAELPAQLALAVPRAVHPLSTSRATVRRASGATTSTTGKATSQAVSQALVHRPG